MQFSGCLPLGPGGHSKQPCAKVPICEVEFAPVSPGFPLKPRKPGTPASPGFPFGPGGPDGHLLSGLHAKWENTTIKLSEIAKPFFLHGCDFKILLEFQSFLKGFKCKF